MNLRIGYGEDAHALAAGQTLIIGGVSIPDSPHGTIAHSDGDVLFHALADALLSCFALGDIGTYYPPSNPSYRHIDSAEIVQGVKKLLDEQVHNWQIHNIAAVVTLDTPKLGRQRSTIAARVAQIMALEPQQIGITFKTSEGLAKQHIQARVSLLMSYHKL